MDFRDMGSEAMTTDTIDASTVTDTTDAAAGTAKRPYPVEVDHSRDALLTDFGKETLKDRYLLPGESYQDLFVRVASAYADDAAHAQRLYDYISRLWFMPATPVLSNGGTGRGLPISCYLNSVPDSLNGIVDTWNENVWLASRGGGIGTYWGSVRGIGEPVGLNGKTSGIIPFVRVMDSLTLAISQGSLRRGSAACYLDISHPEIEEFLEIRKPSGDFNRKALNLHHGVLIPDAFMEAVRDGAEWTLRSPKDQSERGKVDARALFQKLVETRLATGEPYIVFADHVNKNMPRHHRELGLKVSTSNLCSEITLPTGKDHLGNERTAVCCLSSLNLETWDEWKDEKGFVEDVMRFLDNVLQDYIDRHEPGMERAAYSAARERSVGLGVMGFPMAGHLQQAGHAEHRRQILHGAVSGTRREGEDLRRPVHPVHHAGKHPECPEDRPCVPTEPSFHSSQRLQGWAPRRPVRAACSSTWDVRCPQGPNASSDCLTWSPASRMIARRGVPAGKRTLRVAGRCARTRSRRPARHESDVPSSPCPRACPCAHADRGHRGRRLGRLGRCIHGDSHARFGVGGWPIATHPTGQLAAAGRSAGTARA